VLYTPSCLVLALRKHYDSAVRELRKPPVMLFKKRASFANCAENKVLHPPSVISTNLKITGDLVGDGDVHVSGTVDGDIKCGNLTVGEGAGVKGQIHATKVTILGLVHGSIAAKTVTLGPTARIVGDVTYEKLEVESGAFFEGYYKQSTPQPTAVEEAETKLAVEKPSIEGRSLSEQGQPPHPKCGPLRKDGTLDTPAAVGDSKAAKENTLHAQK
jgi:cytoskeletal protein CcmA (bactofilin family)